MTEIELFDYINPRRDLPQATCDIIHEIYEILQRNSAKSGWHFVRKGLPPKAGLYLCYRQYNYKKVYELILWTGEYWATGGDVDDVIIAWCELPEPPKEIE